MWPLSNQYFFLAQSRRVHGGYAGHPLNGIPKYTEHTEMSKGSLLPILHAYKDTSSLR